MGSASKTGRWTGQTAAAADPLSHRWVAGREIASDGRQELVTLSQGVPAEELCQARAAAQSARSSSVLRSAVLPLTPPEGGVGGGVRVCVPFPKAVVWHTYGTVDCAKEKGSP
jgi:hypothetical protein